MGQNYFYDLPDDIIDMIMFEAHKVSFKQTLNIIGYAILFRLYLRHRTDYE
ncbi:hypothetical protein PGAG_00119 [Phaeocystis globosa virus 12T]|uniref:Uncharacterized protein n=1 Tax=Phaeocystis globosa virus PgV-16T TaxID=3071227 RepID=A0AC59EWZ7_9VIRU|nr:hypothetical protein PGCG_00160 [Phaeocystis globosa virus]AET73008.1 hypothetical protein PGAG_00119 [Phaeocystis globosa virus 12T]AET73830.1 hypothetical protein PGBG_00122 [Phaeocystis globosa virus 14T]AGM15471.1 hypothetical protein PGCG_00160 [Phaeocystis globosa virus PgV-16T]UYE94201.1 hypothetical protein PGV14T_00160 [Phaeocystis globosa virus]